MLEGTLIIEIFGELKFDDAVEKFMQSVDYSFRAISTNYNSEYYRFGFIAATIKYVIPMKIFIRSNNFWDSIRIKLNKSFIDWEIKVSLHYVEKDI